MNSLHRLKIIIAVVLLISTSAFSQNYDTVLELNPVGYWPSDDGKGEVLRDLSPNKNHAELHNLHWEGNLLNFKGLFQWAEIPASVKYQSRKFSMGGWVFLRGRVRGGYNDRLNYGRGMTFMGNGYHTSSYSLNTLNQDEVLFNKSTWRVEGGSPEGASICIRRGERVDILSNGQDDALGTAGTVGQATIGEWQHILYTYESPAQIDGGEEWVSLQDADRFFNAGTAKLYVNGELVKIKDRVEFKPRLAPFLIGSDAWWWLQAVTSGSLDGSVRDLVIFDRAVSSQEVAKLYKETTPEIEPQVFNNDAIFINEEVVEVQELSKLQKESLLDVLLQLDKLDVESLEKYTPWLKTQHDATAVKLLLKLGEVETIKGFIPAYVKSFQDQSLSNEERTDALLALAECKGLARDAALNIVVAELKTMQPQIPKIEEHYRNALINVVFEMDPENDILEIVRLKSEGRLFSQGDEMRDSRPETDNGRAYTSSAKHQGTVYSVGTGVAWEGVEPVSAKEFEQIAKEVEVQYPGVRRWAEGKDLARVYATKTKSNGTIEKFYPLGKKFVFDKTDGKLRGWSIAFDKDGYIHLTGGMHNAPVEENFMPGSWESWGMSREIKNDKYPTILYWVSKRPGDIESLEFVGCRSNERNVPVALGLNYMNFVQDRNNELYLYGRIYVQGIQSWGMYRYDTNTKSWVGLGGFASDVKKEFPFWADRFITMAADWLAMPSIRWKNNHPNSKVLVWSLQPHFYNFIRGWGIQWDLNNRMHIQVPHFALDKNNRVVNMQLYAYSDDEGKTFYGANGKMLALPLTANPGEGNACLYTEQNIKYWKLWCAILTKAGYNAEGLNLINISKSF